MPRKIKTIVFDLDGTLVDTREDIANAVNAMLLHFGFEALTVEEVTDKVGQGITVLLQRVLPSSVSENLEAFHTFFYSYYAAHVADYSKPYDGVEETLAKLSHIKLAILTNKYREFGVQLLDSLRLTPYFVSVYGGGQPYPAKPAPEALLALLAEIGVDPADAMMVGDSPSDILTGQRAGTATCAVNYGYRSVTEMRNAGADIYLNTFSELLDYVI
ncbi:MAG: HAD-IA family hydrolase [Deferribacteres bacterium]|nr:HAD-IA family hydrolase [candidate division KSB1 bacterium]MCB9503586.1 HAD-IA family hydrolase [Deferribacteres bacterium]